MRTLVGLYRGKRESQPLGGVGDKLGGTVLLRQIRQVEQVPAADIE